MIDAILARHARDTAPSAGRDRHLIERIKIETRWLLLKPQPPTPVEYTVMRRTIVTEWPRMRHRRLSNSEIAQRFYDIAAEHALTLATLIATRRATCS